MIAPGGAPVKHFSLPASPYDNSRHRRAALYVPPEDEPAMRPLHVAAALALLAAASAARAERALEKRDKADLVVSGKVEKITTKTDKFGNDGEITHYTAKVAIDKVEKGDAKAGDTIEVKWSHVTKRPSKTFVGAYGHGYGLKEKDEARLWLRKGRDGWDVIYNKEGVEKLEKK
jgi:hypothetical protein